MIDEAPHRLSIRTPALVAAGLAAVMMATAVPAARAGTVQQPETVVAVPGGQLAGLIGTSEAVGAQNPDRATVADATGTVPDAAGSGPDVRPAAPGSSSGPEVITVNPSGVRLPVPILPGPIGPFQPR